MDCAPDIAPILDGWLKHFGENLPRGTSPPTPGLQVVDAPADPATTVAALAALAAEALARQRTLRIVTADDRWLPEISNAIDLRWRPLCLVLPGAVYAGHIALRATLALLKSRLARAAADSEGPAWADLRDRLQSDDQGWRNGLAWSARGLDDEPPPAGLHAFFPVRIGPTGLDVLDSSTADWKVLIPSADLPATHHPARAGIRRTLLLREAGGMRGIGLVPDGASDRLRTELDVLGQELAEMELELATAQAELAGFVARYQGLITGRMAELDRLQAELAAARLRRAPDDVEAVAGARQAEARAAQSQREHEAFCAREDRPPADFAPADEIKKRFRQLAQKIHPDRASDESDRVWRTQLMSEANRAYRAGDRVALDEVLALWLEGRPGAVSSAPESARTAGLKAQIARIRSRLRTISGELDRLYGSTLYELFAAARVAERQGRDLLAEMAARLDQQLDSARQALATAG